MLLSPSMHLDTTMSSSFTKNILELYTKSNHKGLRKPSDFRNTTLLSLTMENKVSHISFWPSISETHKDLLTNHEFRGTKNRHRERESLLLRSRPNHECCSITNFIIVTFLQKRSTSSSHNLNETKWLKNYFLSILEIYTPSIIIF